jgi:methionine aminotransferase
MSQLSLRSKLPAVGTSIFSVMSAMAREHGAINLSQGFPDFPVDPRLTERVTHWMTQGANQYAPSPGVPALRQRISALAQRLYSASYDPETEVTVTSGGTEALFCALSTLIQPGNEVILFEPAYDSYAPAIELNGGIPVFIPLSYPGYKIPWDLVKKRVNRQTRVIILNTPHNPAGSVLTAQDMKELQKIVKNNDIWLVSDEVYEHIIFDGLEHQSIARFPDLASRAFIISSFGKSFHATGWKVAYCLAPKAMTDEFRKIHQYITFSTATPFQMAIADFMANESWFDELRHFYQAKRDFFRSQLKGSRWQALECTGSYFQLLDFSKITQEADTAFAQRLTTEHKVASIPVSVFYHQGDDNKVLRFCFAKSEETLRLAGEILARV